MTNARRRSALPEPFRVGVSPLGDADWLRLDDAFERARVDRAALHAREPDAVYRRVGDRSAGPAERIGEALDLAGEETLSRVTTALAGARQAPVPAAASPFLRAALSIVEDLAILLRDEAGWRLAEAFIAAPSAWVLGEKIGRTLGRVHAPVPGFADGSANDTLITRMFDALRVERPVVRANWSLHADDARFLPRHAPDHAARLAAAALDELVLRHERQVLQRLPISGTVLFSIDTTIRPVSELATTERESLEGQLATMSPAQRRYRGLPNA